MPQQQDFVVQFNPESNQYLTGITQVSEEEFTYQWGNVENALIYTTLEAAQNQATSIGGGTVGTPKP